MKNIFLKIIIILFGISIMSCNRFAGFLFPKTTFEFSPVGEQPPSLPDERLNAGAEYPQTFTFGISRGGNSFKYNFYTRIFVNKPYRVLHIKEMKYEWENNKGVLLKDRSFDLFVSQYVHNEQNDWYWLAGIGIRGFFHFKVNFEKIFKGKESGDEFLFRLILIYSFDDDPENTQVLEYNVTAVKGKYEHLYL